VNGKFARFLKESFAMATYKILSIGQCGIDDPAIRSMIRSKFDADVESVDSADEAQAEMRRQRFDLVLANRIFDAGGSGLDFISALKSDELLADVPVMLVSDLPSAQAEAVARGALPGFGKAELYRPETAARISAALAG
jgi:CheY-like chemotaxis protein